MKKKIAILSLIFLLTIMLSINATVQGTSNNFANPIYDGADPWVIYDDGYYYYCGSDGERTIYVIKSESITGLGSGERIDVWTAPSSGQNVKYDVWGPHLNYIDGDWYIYYCAQPTEDSTYQSMRMWVLKGNSQDPQGSYSDIGKLYDTQNDIWAIDGSVIERSNGDLYLVWSGLTDYTTLTQHTYIAEMKSPTQIKPGTTVKISSPTETWETNTRGIQEGQRVLKVDDNGRTIIAYSASASWTNDYCLGTLTNTDGNFLNPSSWTKSSSPVFEKTSTVFGPGGASYVKSPDGTEDWIIYHCARYSGSGWDRVIQTQEFTWNTDGSPNFGTPVDATTSITIPSGESDTPEYGWGNSDSGTQIGGSWRYNNADSATVIDFGTSYPNWAHTFRDNVNNDYYTVVADMKLIYNSSYTYPKYGIYAAYKDSNNYVAAFLDGKYNCLSTYAVVNGVSQSWQSTYNLLSDTADFYEEFHTIKVTKQGSTFTFYVDDVQYQQRVFNITNGQIGLIAEEAKADYKNVKVIDNIIDDQTYGTDLNQFNYNGSNWTNATNVVGCHDLTLSFNKTTDEYVTVKFYGTQIEVYGVGDSCNGYVSLSIDGGSEVDIDTYTSTRTTGVLFWTSPTLQEGEHTLKIRVKGTHNSNSTDDWIQIDALVVDQ